MRKLEKKVFSGLIEEIKNMLSDGRFIAAQAVALVTCLVACSSYFTKKKNSYLLLQLLVNILFGVQYYLLLGINTGTIINGVSVLKILYFMYKEKFGKDNGKVELLIILIITVVSGAFFADGWLSVIPIFNSVLFTYAIWQKDNAILRISVIVCCSLWVIYDFYACAYISAVYTFCEMIVAFVTLIKIYSNKKKAVRKCADTKL